VPGSHDVILSAEPGVELDVLKSSGNAEFGKLIRTHAGNSLPVIVDFTFLRLVKAIDAIEQSGLTGPIRSDDSQNLIIPDVQAHLIKGKDPAEAEHKVVNPNFYLSIISHLLNLPEGIQIRFLQIAEGTKSYQQKHFAVYPSGDVVLSNTAAMFFWSPKRIQAVGQTLMQAGDLLSVSR
jgi:hypothetical protein